MIYQLIMTVLQVVPSQAWALGENPPKALGNCKALAFANV